MLKHTDLPPTDFVFPLKRITVCTAVGIGHRDTGEQVNTVQRIVFCQNRPERGCSYHCIRHRLNRRRS